MVASFNGQDAGLSIQRLRVRIPSSPQKFWLFRGGRPCRPCGPEIGGSNPSATAIKESIGVLVELVTMSPCHGEGHGFESRTFRKINGPGA